MTIDEFQKADLRIGKVVSAERVEGSEKLLKLKVDIGPPVENGSSETGQLSQGSSETGQLSQGSSEVGDIRQILTGIAKTHTPEELVGREVVIIANLEPRMMMGLESQGMLLAAHGEDGSAVLLTAIGDVPKGAKIT